MTAASAPLPNEVVQADRPDGRSVLAAFLSFLFPGLGQVYNHERALAMLFAAPVVLLSLLSVAAFLAAQSSLLSRLLDIRFLVGLMVLDVALLGWRLVAVVQAHARRERPSRRHWTSWITALLVAITVVMHAVPAYYAVLGIDTLNAVALGGSSNGGLTGGFGRIPGFSPLPQPSEQPQVERGERVNILLVGVDAAPTRTTQLTDTMLVVSLDPVGGASAMVSVPRDLYGVPLSDGRIYNAKLNSLMAVAETHPADYPLGGVGTLKEAIGELLGIKIHYFAAINLLGFRQAVDSIGGVDVVVQRTINDPTYFDVERNLLTGFYLQAGPHHLDGPTALAFVRSRKGIGDSDFTRAERQQQLLAAMRAKLTAQNLLIALPGLMASVKSAIATDVPSDRISGLAQAVQDADMSHLRRIVLQPPDYMTADPHSPAGYILIPNLEAIHAIGQELLGPSPTPASPTP